jgi:hypothetical protein
LVSEFTLLNAASAVAEALWRRQVAQWRSGEHFDKLNVTPDEENHSGFQIKTGQLKGYPSPRITVHKSNEYHLKGIDADSILITIPLSTPARPEKRLLNGFAA